jgi:hypothetical protein
MKVPFMSGKPTPAETENIEATMAALEDFTLEEIEGVEVDESSDDALEASEEIEEIVEETAIADEETLRDLSADIDAMEAAIESAVESDSAPISLDAEGVAPKAAKVKKERKASEPRAARDLSAIGDENFVLLKGDVADRAAVMALMPTQKKIAEKFENVFLAVAGGKLSTYSKELFRALTEGPKTATELRNWLAARLVSSGTTKGNAYNPGTVASQVGQITHLFPLLKIANKGADGKLSINPDSAIAEKFSKLI